MGNHLRKQHKVFGVVAYCVQSNQYLLTQNKKSGGFWEFPKGYPERRDNGEPLKTALREFEEETGITSSKLKIITHTNDLTIKYLRYGKKEKEATYFLGLIDEIPNKIKIQHSEVADYAWVSYEEALKKITYENCRNMLIKAHEDIQKHLEKSNQ